MIALAYKISSFFNQLHIYLLKILRYKISTSIFFDIFIEVFDYINNALIKKFYFKKLANLAFIGYLIISKILLIIKKLNINKKILLLIKYINAVFYKITNFMKLIILKNYLFLVILNKNIKIIINIFVKIIKIKLSKLITIFQNLFFLCFIKNEKKVICV